SASTAATRSAWRCSRARTGRSSARAGRAAPTSTTRRRSRRSPRSRRRCAGRSTGQARRPARWSRPRSASPAPTGRRTSSCCARSCRGACRGWRASRSSTTPSARCGRGRTMASALPSSAAPAAAWGRARRTGGWALGATALEAVYAAELRIAPATALTAAALEAFGAATVEEVLHSFTRRGGRPPFEASLLAPAVVRLAAGGDEVARRIVLDQGAALGDMARAAARIVGLAGRPYPLVLLGGVLRGEGAELLVGEIRKRVPDGVPVRTRFEPA